MPELVTVHQRDREPILELLQQFPTETPPDWSRLFTHPWSNAEGRRGFALFEGDKAVGFLGFLFAERQGAPFSTINLTTWFVLGPYRSHSLQLQMAVRAIPNSVVTAMTIIPPIVKIYESLGYRLLEDRYVVIPRSFGRSNSERFSFTRIDPTTVPAGMTTVERQIIRDHSPFGCTFLYLQDHEAGRRSLVVAMKVARRLKGRTFNVAHLLGATDLDLFRESIHVGRNAIAKACGTYLLLSDRRFLPEKLPIGSLTATYPTAKMFRGHSSVLPEHVDNLYTEFVLFGY